MLRRGTVLRMLAWYVGPGCAIYLSTAYHCTFPVPALSIFCLIVPLVGPVSNYLLMCVASRSLCHSKPTYSFYHCKCTCFALSSSKCVTEPDVCDRLLRVMHSTLCCRVVLHIRDAAASVTSTLPTMTYPAPATPNTDMSLPDTFEMQIRGAIQTHLLDGDSGYRVDNDGLHSDPCR